MAKSWDEKTQVEEKEAVKEAVVVAVMEGVEEVEREEAVENLHLNLNKLSSSTQDEWVMGQLPQVFDDDRTKAKVFMEEVKGYF